jgi:pimeloyl-ACP methyl ester carboxylesterase
VPNAPVLLLHGALGSSAQLTPVKKLLEKSGRETFSLNFSGHGGTSFSADFSIGSFAQEIINFIRERKLSDVHIFGYSMGGYAAMFAAHMNPENIGKIITLGTKFDWTPQTAEYETKKLNAEKIEQKVPAFAEVLRERHAPNDWKLLVTKTADLMISLGDAPLLDDDILKSLQQDILICLGDADDMADPQYSRKVSEVLPRGHFKLLENTHHLIEKVNQEMLYNVIQDHWG